MTKQSNLSSSFFAGTLSLALLGGSLILMSGCTVWENRPRLRKQKISLNEPVNHIPPIKLLLLNGRHLLVMQAPHSGWNFEIDRDEQTLDGARMFVTVRRPDPTFLYPQAIIEKQLLSDIPADTLLEVYARVLDFDEKASTQGYGLIIPLTQSIE